MAPIKLGTFLSFLKPVPISSLHTHMARLQVDTVRCVTSKSSKLDPSSYGLLSPPDSPAPGVVENTEDTVEVTDAMIARATRLSIPAPVAWPQFKQLVDAKDLQPLGRSFPMQITYEQHKVRMERRFGSIATYLTNHVLADLIAETNAPGFDPHAPLKVSDFVFRANDFPYFLGDDVEHWVMWCKKRLEPGFEPPTPAIDAIEAQFGCSVEWRYFVNPVHRQSVPQLSHAHVFIKRT
ncbi:hypothetical protein J3B01_001714 [Coemansia erecta]|nr:hypothetical protein J3B01_001714 [Coemansia erecta]